jgi:hypothetical protein
VKQHLADILARNDGLFNHPVSRGEEPTVDSLKPRLYSTALEDGIDRAGALNLWSHIVSDFTPKDITYETDRLVIISNIARLFQGRLDWEYVAGQWTDSVYNLLWYPENSSKCHRACYTVPSWSWASVEGSRILFDNETAMDLSCTAEFSSREEKDPVWLPATGGTLKLTATLATKVAFDVRDGKNFVLTRNGVSVDFTPDMLSRAGDMEIKPGSTLICVLVSMTFRSSILGLVLQPCQKPDAYRRVSRLECFKCYGNVKEGDAEDLFGHWFPEVTDMTAIDHMPHKTFIVG